MSTNLSIAQMLAELQKQVAHHREQMQQHTRQEELHREKRTYHTTELQLAEERLEQFEAAAASAGELVERHRAATAPPAPSQEKLPAGKSRPVAKLAARVVASFRPEETFGPTDVAREVNRHYGAILRSPVDGRAVSVALRRLAAEGELQAVRKGTPHHEALYQRRRT